MDTKNHPCFSEEARHKTGRIHLPVAPKCILPYHYCNRVFEYVHVSRPEVMTAVLNTRHAVD